MSRLRVRVSVGAGTPEIFEELLRLDDSARSERLKQLATVGLMCLKQGQLLVRENQVADGLRTPPSPPPSNGLSSVVRRLKLSLDDSSATEH